jgi:S1-C subfamily serine protease
MTARYILPILFVLIVFFEGAGCALTGIFGTAEPTSPTQTESSSLVYSSPLQPSSSTTEVVQSLPDFTVLIASVKPSVVAITTKLEGFTFFGSPFTQEGAGSGWIIDKDGLIVTNSHVVEDATSVTVTLEDGRSFPAESVWSDTVADLAVIKINARDLPALQIGDSSELQVGEWVVAIGNSLGLGISATKGIVSALGVSLSIAPGETLYDLIQTDAAINPGNSGGPLVNMRGEVVGINSVKVAQVGVEGMGYAISTKQAKPIIDRLVKNNKTRVSALPQVSS